MQIGYEMVLGLACAPADCVPLNVIIMYTKCYCLELYHQDKVPNFLVFCLIKFTVLYIIHCLV